MNNFIKITFILSLIVSCDLETVIDLEIPQDPSMIVLNGVLDTDTTISVIISNSVGAFSNTNPAFLPNAEAFLFENNLCLNNGKNGINFDHSHSASAIYQNNTLYYNGVHEIIQDISEAEGNPAHRGQKVGGIKANHVLNAT